MSDDSKLAPKNIFESLVKEAEAYTSAELIESTIESGGNLSQLPMQPLYLALRNLPIDRLSEMLPLLSKKQRIAFLDLDLWNKDELDLDSFENWVLAYAVSPDYELRSEFASSTEFLLYLKGRFNIWTFDVEEPEYPDHDSYFLTDDSLLLFEFDDHYPHIDVIRQLVRDVYSEMGVENAYTFLFKLVSDSFSVVEEEEFEQKKARLAEFGFVDYYDALELHSPFKNEDHLKLQILKKGKTITPDLDDSKKTQGLHKASITAFKGDFDIITAELNKVESTKRAEFLRFNFLRLVNGTLSLSGAIKEGSVAMTKTGQKTRNMLLLGVSYVEANNYRDGHQSIFDKYDFYDLYKIGFNLIRFIQDDLKKSLRKWKFEEDKESFLGENYNEFLDNLFDEIPRLSNTSGPRKKSNEINNYASYLIAKNKTYQLIAILPFADQFSEAIAQLSNEGAIVDDYYMNYTIAEIDLEAITLSSFIHYSLGLIHSGEEKQDHSAIKKNKMGLTIDEFRVFIQKFPFLTDESIEVDQFPKAITNEIKSFAEGFGLSTVPNIEGYINTLLKNHLSGYDFDNLLFEDFKHVGGPILLKALNQ